MQHMVETEDAARERRLRLLIARLPKRLGGWIEWLRAPSHVWARVPAGLLLVAGGFLAILPIFGLWMLPLGIVLLAEDIPWLRRLTGRLLAWIEHRHPAWLGAR